MKLRLHDNSLRLRLSQPEVTQFGETGHVQNTLTFSPGRTLTYSLETAPVQEVAAAFEGNRLSVVVPAPVAQKWIHSDQTGIEGASASLKILIEKDFQCLHRSSEEDRQAFPNPLAQPVK